MRQYSAERKTREPAPPRKVNPFRYGWRYVQRVGSDGQIELVQVPLRLRDVLHPREGDVISEAMRHEQERGYLPAVFRSRLSRLRNGLVTSDCIIDWGVAGVGNHSPDVAAFDRVRRPPPPETGTFRIVEYGARCLLAVELVSPETRVNDVRHKLAHYHRVGVRLYVIVDQRRDEASRELLAYRWTRQHYTPMRPDAQGRIPLKLFGISLGLVDNRVWAFDLETGERIPDAAEMAKRLADSEQRVRQLEAELRRLRGESAQ